MKCTKKKLSKPMCADLDFLLQEAFLGEVCKDHSIPIMRIKSKRNVVL